MKFRGFIHRGLARSRIAADVSPGRAVAGRAGRAGGQCHAGHHAGRRLGRRAGGCRGRPRCRVVVRRPGQAVAPGTLGPTIHAIDGCVLRGCQARLGGGSLGAILSTADGGNPGRSSACRAKSRPLFAVHFFDARQGVAVGLWSLVLTTEDGGKTWTEQPLQAPPGAKRADLNLMGLFADNHGTLYATAEHGQVLRSDDQGRTGVTWIPAMRAPCGLARCWPMGVCCWVVSVAPCCRSSADGKAFRRVPTQGKGSVTSIAVAGARVLAVGLDGLKVRSRDGGNSFQEAPSADGLSLTAALFNADGTPLLFSRRGVMPRQE